MATPQEIQAVKDFEKEHGVKVEWVVKPDNPFWANLDELVNVMPAPTPPFPAGTMFIVVKNDMGAPPSTLREAVQRAIAVMPFELHEFISKHGEPPPRFSNRWFRNAIGIWGWDKDAVRSIAKKLGLPSYHPDDVGVGLLRYTCKILHAEYKSAQDDWLQKHGFNPDECIVLYGDDAERYATYQNIAGVVKLEGKDAERVFGEGAVIVPKWLLEEHRQPA